MAEIRFDKLVNKHLRILIRKYGYKIKFTNYSNYPDPTVEDGEVKISNSKTLIYIMKSRFDYALTIRPAGEPSFTQKSPIWIMDALSIPIETPPRDIQLGSFEWFLVKNVYMLNTYCKSFLEGDFSRWLEILEYFNKKIKEDYFVRTGKELPPYIYRDLDEYIKSKKLQGHYP